jgi:hypothetical protein
MGRPRKTAEETLAARERKRARERLRYEEKTAYKRELFISAGLSPRLAHNRPGPNRLERDQWYLRVEQARQKYGMTKKEMARALDMKPNTLSKGIRRAMKNAPIIR